MHIEQIVVNASPLICLGKAGLLHLLPALFKKIVVPSSVIREVTLSGVHDTASIAVSHADWLQIVSATPLDIRVAAWGLGSGESDVISFALHSPSYRAVLDDREARRCAETFGCRVIGTAGVLLLARRHNLIPSLRTAFNQLQQAGLWLSDILVNELCSSVDE